MLRIHTLMRPLVVALAIVALAAPTALAAAGPPQLHKTQPDGTPSGETGPVYWSYEYEAPVPQAQPNADDDGTPGTALAVGLAGGVVLLGAAAAMTSRTRLRARRARVAA